MAVEATNETNSPVLDMARLESDLARLRPRYQRADPYPHVVLDNFLEPLAVEAAIKEFPPIDPDQWTNYLHTNKRKFSNTAPETWGPTLRRILEELNSPRFVRFVGELIGVDEP